MPFHELLVSGDALVVFPVHQPTAVDWSWVNMPSARAFLFGSSRHVMRYDLGRCREARLMARVMATPGATGSQLRAMYATAFSTDVNDYSDLGETPIVVSVDAANVFVVSSWVTIVAAARADVWLAVMGENGNGAADPVLGSVFVQCR